MTEARRSFDLPRAKKLVSGRDKWISTHYDGCTYEHVYCALDAALKEIELLRSKLPTPMGAHPISWDENDRISKDGP